MNASPHPLFDVDLVCLDVLTDPSGHAVSEFRIFRKGQNSSTKGIFDFSDNAAKSCMDAFSRMGRRVSVDYNHASLNKNPVNPAEAGKSAGSFVLALRDGELWATSVDWTEAGRKAIEAKEYLFYSPAFSKDAKTNEPTWIISVGLTNDPSLFNLSDLAIAASALYADMTTRNPTMLAASPSASAPPLFPAGSVAGGSSPRPSPPMLPGTPPPAASSLVGNLRPSPLASADTSPQPVASVAHNTPVVPDANPYGQPVAVVPVPIGNPTFNAVKRASLEAAARTASRWILQNPQSRVAPLDPPQHVSAMLPLTGAYPSPAAVGGWLGWIEPGGILQTPAAAELENRAAAFGTPPPTTETTTAPTGSGRNWICFVHTDGRCFLWNDRDATGGVVGNPESWQRDLTTLSVGADAVALGIAVNGDVVVSLADREYERTPDGKFGSAGAASAGFDAADKGEAAGKSGGPRSVAAGKESAVARTLSAAVKGSPQSTSLNRAAEAAHTGAAIQHTMAAAASTKAGDVAGAAAHTAAATAHTEAAGAHGEAAKGIDAARAARAKEVLQGANHVNAVGGKFGAKGTDEVQGRVHWAGIKAAEMQKPVYMVAMKPGAEKHSSEGGIKIGYKAPAKGEYHVAHPDGRITHHNVPVTKASADVDDAVWLGGAGEFLDDAEMLSALVALDGFVEDDHPRVDGGPGGGQFAPAGGGGGDAAKPAGDAKTPAGDTKPSEPAKAPAKGKDAPAAPHVDPEKAAASDKASHDAVGGTTHAAEASQAALTKPSVDAHTTAAAANTAAAAAHRDAATAAKAVGDKDLAAAHLAQAKAHAEIAREHKGEAAKIVKAARDAARNAPHPGAGSKGADFIRKMIEAVIKGSVAIIKMIKDHARRGGSGGIGRTSILSAMDGNMTTETLAAVGQRRVDAGQFSYGKAVTPGLGGEAGDILRAGISRRADVASHAAHNAGTVETHQRAAAVNRDVATEHLDVAAEHRKIAGTKAGAKFATTHEAEAVLHEGVAKKLNDRADRHDATAEDIVELQRRGPQTPQALAVDADATVRLHGLAGPCAGEVVDAADYDYRRGNAMASAEAALADPAVHRGSPPDHPAATSPLTGRFVDPLTQGGAQWLGWIEPAQGEWICFVAIDGTAVLYTKRQVGMNDLVRDGAGLGAPIIFARDIATLSCADDHVAIDAASLADVAMLSAVPFKSWPVDDADAWDGTAAVLRLRKWASHDGSGDPDTVDYAKYAAGFADVKEASGADGAHTLADYALPHHDVVDGKVVTSKPGVYAAAQRLSSTDIPDADVAAVKDHLARHYHQWDSKAPWESNDQGKVTDMHAKLAAFAKDKGFDKDALKAHVLNAVPTQLHAACMSAMGSDESKHPKEPVMDRIMAHLDLFKKGDGAVPDDGDEAANALTKHLSALLNGLPPPSIMALSSSMGLPPSAPERDVITGVATMLHSFGELKALTGETTVQAAVTTARAWKTSAEEGRTAIARLSALAVEKDRADAIASLDKVCVEKGLSPAQKTEALSILGGENGTVMLSVYLRGATGSPALAAPNGGAPVPSNLTPTTAAQVEALNAAGHLPGVGRQPAPAATGTDAKPQLNAVARKFVTEQMGPALKIENLSAAEITELNALTAADVNAHAFA